MDNNLYQMPKAALDKPVEGAALAPFYVVALPKFTALYLATLGGYQLYWSYKNWSNYKRHCQRGDLDDQDIWPAARALVSVFFTHALFDEVAAHAALQNRPRGWRYGWHATLIVLLLIASAVLDRLARNAIGSPATDLLALFVLVPLCLSLRAATRRINAACGDPEGAANARFTTANYVWMGLGGLAWAMLLSGLWPMVAGGGTLD